MSVCQMSFESFTTYTASGAHDSNMAISLYSTSHIMHVQAMAYQNRNNITRTTSHQHQQHLDHLLMLLLPSFLQNTSTSRVAYRPNVGPPTAMTAPQSLRVNPLRHPANQFPHVAKQSSTLTSFTCGFTPKSAYQASSSGAQMQELACPFYTCRLSSHDVSSSFSFSVVSPDLTCSRHPSLR